MNEFSIDRQNVCHKQKAATLDEPKDKPKAKKATKSKYEELPEIPDYERPELEKYAESAFDPSKKDKVTQISIRILINKRLQKLVWSVPK